MKLSSNKKIVLLGIILLILAGIIVVALKGMKVDLMLTKHKSIDIVIGKEFNINDVRNICNEVFKDKDVVLRKVENFGDAVSINATTISDEEKQNLITKINEKFEISLVADDIEVRSNSNIRIRDMIRPYFAPVCVSFVMIYAYVGIRFKKLNALKVLLSITGIILVTEAVITSLVAISRIPVSPIIVNLMLVIAVTEIIIFIYKKEEELKSGAVKAKK